MLRLVAVTVLGAVLLVGCGSGGDSGSAKDEAGTSPSASPTPTYFVRADSDRINKVAEKARKAAVTAQAQKRIDACDAAGGQGYAAWRRCWHALLDPFLASLEAMSTTMRRLSARDFPQACRDELEKAAGTFSARAETVFDLLAGIDSEKRADQNRAMQQYTTSLQKMARSWSEPFQALTQACYSPEDLESINASPSPSP
jgi:hypothetical protein